MVDTLISHDEASCVEDATVGVATMMVYFKAVKQFCPDLIEYNAENLTYEGRALYEVVIHEGKEAAREDRKSVILIDAGQDAGVESVGLAMFFIEQLIACQENHEMIEKMRWVVLPCTNPDGMEYARFNRNLWRKNLRLSEDKLSMGVDITRNFDSQWGSCDRVESGFSPMFPGISPLSENETIFVKNILIKYKKDIMSYISIRRDGHAILYPYASSKNKGATNIQPIMNVAAEVASRVNLRAGGIQVFANESIFEANGCPHCGHSVDYAYDSGIPFPYEMRVFLGSDNRLMSKFQQLPKGNEAALRNGYFTGIRALFNALLHDRKYVALYK